MKKLLSSKYLFLLIGALLGIFVLIFALRYLVVSSKDVGFHEHADFALFIDGKQFDFSESRYMSLEPCKVTHNGLFPAAYAHGGQFEEGELSSAVHLHNNKGGTIHLHKEGITYEDFFESIGMKFHDSSFEDADGNFIEANQQKEFRFILNGEEVDTMESRLIRDLDRVLISYGDKGRVLESLIQEYGYITNDACIASESCGHREPPEPENCAETPTPVLLRMIGL